MTATAARAVAMSTTNPRRRARARVTNPLTAEQRTTTSEATETPLMSTPEGSVGPDRGRRRLREADGFAVLEDPSIAHRDHGASCARDIGVVGDEDDGLTCRVQSAEQFDDFETAGGVERAR